MKSKTDSNSGRAGVAVDAFVRHLVWKKSQTAQEKHHKILKWVAQTPWGRYTIRRSWKGGYILGFKLDLQEDFFGGTHHWTLAAAKLGAQADFTNRVMDCLANITITNPSPSTKENHEQH